MMVLHTLVRNPERITNPKEIEGIINELEDCKKIEGEECVILVSQKRLTGGYFSIETKKEAEESIQNKGPYEWGIEYYPPSYFEEKLKEYSK